MQAPSLSSWKTLANSEYLAGCIQLDHPGRWRLHGPTKPFNFLDIDVNFLDLCIPKVEDFLVMSAKAQLKAVEQVHFTRWAWFLSNRYLAARLISFRPVFTVHP